MNFPLSSDDLSDTVSGGSVSADYLPVAASVASDKSGVTNSLTEQVTGKLLATVGDEDSIAEVDGLTQLHRRQIDKVPSDTPDSVLSTSDTLSSYSGCSIGGVGEPFVAVFGGVQEVSQDDVWNEVDNGNDDDSAVHVCSVDGSLCGSVASSQDHGSHECISGVSLTESDAVHDECAQKVESNSASGISYCSVPSEVRKHCQERYQYPAGVKSSTALILECRPCGLPSKSKEEERKHRKLYEAVVESAKRKERKAEEERRKELEKRWKYEEEMSHLLGTWKREILPSWDVMRNTKMVRDLWWRGLPASIRGQVWKLSVANELNITSVAHAVCMLTSYWLIELYEICLQRAEERLRSTEDTFGSDSESLASFSDSVTNHESSVDVIRLDVSRTFPHLGIFQKGGPYHNLLQGLLGAYACYRPDVGYVQGMSFVAAVLLLNMDVHDAFTCFANLLNRPCQIAFFRLDRNLMKVYFNTYEEFLRENLPRLYLHFTKCGLTSDLYLIDWIFTLYAKALSLDTASRIWDVFFRDGEEFLFRTAIGILKLYETTLLQRDFIQLAEFLTRLPSNVSCDGLFQSIDAVSMSSKKQSYAEVLARYQTSR